MRKHKVLPRNEAPCWCGHPKKSHFIAENNSYCMTCYSQTSHTDVYGYEVKASQHLYKLDNLKYLDVLKNWNETGVIQYPV